MRTAEVRIGGLLRCCLASLDEHMARATEDPKEGDKLECHYCKSPAGGMIFRNRAWEWDHER